MHHVSHLVGLLSAAAILSSSATCQTLSWSKQAPATSPSARTKHRLAHDLTRRRTYMYGGIDASNQTLDETWSWDGKTWTKLSPTTSPPGRWQHAMSFDLSRRRVVVFSGWAGGSYRTDTWEFDGTNWKDVTPSASPPARDHHAMVYDIARRKCVMFGGWNFVMSRTLFNDTWEWDGTSWTQITTTGAPDTRDGHAMAFDARRNVIVLFGGGRERPQNRAVRGDTWIYDGAKKTWTKANPTNSPAPRFNHRMAYDRVRGVVVLFGGRDTSQTFNDVWEWNGSNWTKVNTPRSPSPRQYADMVFDTATQRCLSFGGDLNAGNGAGSNNDTWLYGRFTPAAYDTFGAGCASGSQGCQPCTNRNFTRRLAAKTTSASQIALFETTPSALQICGADLYCSARSGTVDVTLGIWSFDTAKSEPGRQLASAKVRVTTTAATYGVRFPPVSIPATGLYFVVFDNADKLNLPVSPTGSTSLHYEFAANAWSPKQDTRWQYAVRCDKGARVPLLSNTGAPIIGTSFQVDLTGAPPSRPTAGFFGFSDKTWGPFQLPLDLAPAAPGCKVLVSGELVFGLITDAQGAGAMTIPLPADTALLKLQLFQQFLVTDPTANALGLISTRGGRATVGDS